MLSNASSKKRNEVSKPRFQQLSFRPNSVGRMRNKNSNTNGKDENKSSKLFCETLMYCFHTNCSQHRRNMCIETLLLLRDIHSYILVSMSEKRRVVGSKRVNEHHFHTERFFSAPLVLFSSWRADRIAMEPKRSPRRDLYPISYSGESCPPPFELLRYWWLLHDIGNLVYNSFGKKRTHAKYNNISCIVPYKRQSVQKNAKNWMAFFWCSSASSLTLREYSLKLFCTFFKGLTKTIIGWKCKATCHNLNRFFNLWILTKKLSMQKSSDETKTVTN